MTARRGGRQILNELLNKRYGEKEAVIGPELMRETERMIMLNVIDNQWKDHLLSMDHLKEGIGLRGYGQKDPLIEYKKESYVLFQDMMDRIEDETIRYLFFLQVTTGAPPPGSYRLGDDGRRPAERRREAPSNPAVLARWRRRRGRGRAKRSRAGRRGRRRRAGPRNPRCWTLPATSSARKKRNWPRSSSAAARPAARRISP